MMRHGGGEARSTRSRNDILISTKAGMNDPTSLRSQDMELSLRRHHAVGLSRKPCQAPFLWWGPFSNIHPCVHYSINCGCVVK